jgi:hypothetical protein
VPLHVRRATPGDLDTVAALTRHHRHQLAAWEPTFWRAAEGADELHPLWLGHLLRSSDAVARVVLDGDDVVACGICVRQPAQWFADDLATATDDRWADAGRLLLEHIEERPAVTCVPHRDRLRAAAATEAGWEHVSDYRTLRLDPGPAEATRPTTTTARSTDLPAPPPHTFGGPVDLAAPGAVVVDDGQGVAVASPPLPAPPIYDPGGTSCVVDRVAGPDRAGLLDRVAAAAAAAGAAQLIVVCAAGDDELRQALDERGAGHPVEVHRAPAGATSCCGPPAWPSTADASPPAWPGRAGPPPS